MPRPPEPVQWVRYYLGGALLQLTDVSPAAELAHRRISDFYWQTGVWPSLRRGNAASLARAHPARWPAILAELRSLGWQTRYGILAHDQVRAIRAQAVKALLAQRRGGQQSAARNRRPDHPPTQPAATHPGYLKPPTRKVRGKKVSTTKIQPDPKRLTAERSPRSPSSLSKPRPGEVTFIQHVAETFMAWHPDAADRELTNWGGWWRNRFRENPDKATTILNEIRSMVREHRPVSNPGAAAQDLWKRLP